MGLFSWLTPTTKSEESDEVFEKRSKLEQTRQRNAHTRELARLEIEKQKLQMQQEIDELKETLDEQREERELRRLEREARRREIEEELDHDDESEGDASPESMLIGIIGKALGGKINPQAQEVQGIPINAPPQDVNIAISPDKIKQIWQSMPEPQKVVARSMSDEDLKKVIVGQIPNIDEASLNYAVLTVRES